MKFFIGHIPFEIGDVQSLQNLDLSYNMFDGEIPYQIRELKSLEKMIFSHNNLSGSVPTSFSQRLSLVSVDISYNQLEGSLPNIAAFQNAPFDALRNNKDLCGNNMTGLRHCDSPKPNERSGKKILAIATPLVLGTCFLLAFVIGCLFVRRGDKGGRSENEANDANRNVFDVWSFDGKLAYENIIEATEDFNPRHCVGVGGHGSVFKVVFLSGQVAAVKKLHV